MDRHARLARNETIFREVNERIEELAQRGELTRSTSCASAAMQTARNR